MNVLTDRRAIRSLRVGVVPSSHVLRLSVGLEFIRRELESEIRKLPVERHRAFVISGEWGTGKSNLLSYMREYVLTRNYAIACVNLNGRAAAINHPQRFYHRVASDLRLPGVPEKGLSYFIETIENSVKGNSSLKWAYQNRQHSELAEALLLLSDGNRQKAFQVLLGADLGWADYQYKKDKALKRINDLGSYLKHQGFSGLMIQFDELETIDQLWNSRSRNSAYRMLYQLMSMPHIWPVFSATEKFNRRLRIDRQSGIIYQDTFRSFIDLYEKSPSFKPPVFDMHLANDLLNHIIKLYHNVYGIDDNIQLKEVLDRWGHMAFNNPRRLIRNAIDYLDRNRRS